MTGLLLSFCDDLNLHISAGLFKLRVPTKVTSKRIIQANYFYRTLISRTTTHPQYWNLILIKYPSINLFYVIMELCIPVSTFNPIGTFVQYMKNFCMKICKEHYEPHRIYLKTEENQSQAVRKQFFFLCEVVASKVWCYIRTTITCKNRHHVLCGLAHGGEWNFSKIVTIEEINHSTLCGCVR